MAWARCSCGPYCRLCGCRGSGVMRSPLSLSGGVDVPALRGRLFIWPLLLSRTSGWKNFTCFKKGESARTSCFGENGS